MIITVDSNVLLSGFTLANSNEIITLDPGYYKNYFPQLKIFE
jgi:hypothetical protein